MEDKPDPLGVVFIQKASYTEFQRALHDVEDSEEILPSKFDVEVKKTSWSTLIPCTLPHTEESDWHIYTPDTRMDYLLYTYLIQKLVPVKVHPNYADKFQISWCNNLMHNIVSEAYLEFGEKPGPKLTNKWLDIHAQFFMKSETGKPEIYEYMIGNCGILCNWSNELPAWKIAGPQPWFYSEHEKHAVPLFLTFESKMKLYYKFNLSLKKLIRMRTREKESDPWRYIQCQPMFLEGVTDDTQLPTPTMWGKYSNISESEKRWHKKWPHQMLASDIIGFGTSNPSPSGSDVEIKIKSETPIQSLYWIAEHCRSVEINNNSNYTTNPIDSSDGWNPIKSTTHKYGNRTAFIQDDIQSNMLEAWYHAGSAPRKRGFAMYSNGYQAAELGTDVGIVYTPGVEGSLIFSLNTENPLEKFQSRQIMSQDEARERAYRELLNLETTLDERDIKDKFKIYLIGYTFSIITFEDGKKVEIDDGSDPEKLKKNYRNLLESNHTSN